jgi:hypothetical protein
MAFDWSKLNGPKPDLRPETQAFIDRVKEKGAAGAVTLKEWQEFRGRSVDFEAVYPLLDAEALIYQTRYAMKNCARPNMSTYEYSLMEFLLPALIGRFEKLHLAIEQAAALAKAQAPR